MEKMWTTASESRANKTRGLHHYRIYGDGDNSSGLIMQEHDGDKIISEHAFSDVKGALRHLSEVLTEHATADADHDEAESPEYASDSEFSGEQICDDLRGQIGAEVRTAKATRRKHEREATKIEKKHQHVFRS